MFKIRFPYSFLFLFLLISANLNVFAQNSSDSSRFPKEKILVDSADYSKADSSFLGEYSEAYYMLQKLNIGFAKRPASVNLQTPQAAMEHFVLSCKKKEYETASFAMNLNLIPENEQKEIAKSLAEKFYYVLDKRVSISWDDLPDRPDAQVNQATAGMKAVAGKPRRSIKFGDLSLDGRTIELRLQRVKIANESPIWLISSNTVENIESLYAKYGPNKFEQHIPSWANTRLIGVAIWKLIGIVLLAIVCFLIAKISRKIISKSVRKIDKDWAIALSSHIAKPLSLALSVFVFYFVMSNVLSVAGSFSPYLYSILLITVIGSITWLIMRAINYFMDRIVEMEVGDISDEENTDSRRYLTYISVARKVITFIVIIIGIGIVVSQFQSLQNLGISLLASAGVATVVLGIAAQSTLGNIVAGMQIAITRPANIGDSVIFEGEYGTIEDIRFTFLVIKTWDERRVVVPLKYFINHPFENWSMNDPHMLKPIMVYADHKIDVDKVRNKFEELLKESDDYDEENPPKTEVVSSSKEVIDIRLLCSAKDSSTAWALHCKLREKMLAYVAQLENGNYLAKERVEIVDRINSSEN